MKIRRFNAAGLAQFSQYLNEKKLTATPPPRHLLDDDRYAEIAPVNGDLELQAFNSKFDLGMAVCSTVGRQHVSKLLRDEAVWPWLSLFYSDSTMPNRDGLWFLGDASRHMLGGNKAAWKEYDHYHRHLVRGAVQSVFQFNDLARVLMGKPSEHTKVEEQLLSRKVGSSFAYSRPLIELVHRLYWDGPKGRLKKGAASTNAGSVVRLVNVLRQIDVTYDLSSLSVDQLYALLPAPEFRPDPDGAVRGQA